MSENYSKAKKKRDKNKPLQRYGSKRRLSRKKNHFFGFAARNSNGFDRTPFGICMQENRVISSFTFSCKRAEREPPSPHSITKG